MADSETLRGIVKWFNDAKGFGFIEHSTGKDVFVHYSVIEDAGFKTLKDGEEVLYEIEDGPKGLHAVKVYRAAGSPAHEAAGAPASSDSGDSDDDSSEVDAVAAGESGN
jgi:cold shock protein